MSITFIGSSFSIKDIWGPQENKLIELFKTKIDTKFPNDKNLIINLTWFGPQFEPAWQQVQFLITNNKKFNRIFWLSLVDPICILPAQFQEIETGVAAEHMYYIGGFDNSSYNFNFSSIPTKEDFIPYADDEILLTDLQHLFLCYNRKPHPHRIELVEKIYKNNLEIYGVVTLGKNDVNYNVSQEVKTNLYLTVDESKQDYSYNGKFLIQHDFGGIPYDVYSLGRLDIWQTHFLNIVSETAFNPWDNLFITEKTWKPILGLRPFVINGQTTIYKYLQDNGFKTFNHYFNGIELEDLKEFEVHDAIINVIKYLAILDKSEIIAMFNDMLPDLKYNRDRFSEFAKEQQYKIDHIFKE
tara:strand:+ start:154 stop:1218 length:1065 start_codon:yes stop_codon:yes gene_type:complete